MGMIGTHLLIDLYGIASDRLNDCRLLELCLSEAASACALTPLGPPHMHAFEGGGVTGVIMLSESHIALHTYPEFGFVAIDVFSCGAADSALAVDVFRRRLAPVRELMTRTDRGTEIG